MTILDYGPGTPALPDASVTQALTHPLRVKLLTVLADGRDKASPSEVADELGVPLPNLSYHVRQLDSLRLIVPAGVRARRGSLEHYYRLASGEVLERVLDLAKAIEALDAARAPAERRRRS